jgi:hypothetical protein
VRSDRRSLNTEIAGGGVGLVKIRNHPRDRKYAEASTISFFDDDDIIIMLASPANLDCSRPTRLAVEQN